MTENTNASAQEATAESAQLDIAVELYKKMRAAQPLKDKIVDGLIQAGLNTAVMAATAAVTVFIAGKMSGNKEEAANADLFKSTEGMVDNKNTTNAFSRKASAI